MSETMQTLTREQIEQHLETAKQYAKAKALGSLIDSNQLAALCTMALSSIAMREALKPFKGAMTNLSSVPDDEKLVVVYAQYAPQGGVGTITAGDLRRAAAAYNSQEQGK